MSVFVDSNVFIAAADAGEARHAQAREVLRGLTEANPFTSDHVVVEVWAILRKRAGWDAAERFTAGLRRSPVALESISLADLERAAAIGSAWVDQGFDLVDRTSMALMERLGCRRVATYDRDFAVYRTGAARRGAFDVLP